jgi:carboxylesterase
MNEGKSLTDAGSATEEVLDITLRAGGREAVILVHGLTGAPDEMRFIAKKLHMEGYDVFAPLLAGHGANYATIMPTGWKDWLGTLTQTYDAIRGDYERIHVAGICVGGMLGLLMGQTREIASCTIYAPVFEFNGWSMPKSYIWLRWFWWLIYAVPGGGRIVVKEVHPFGLKDERLRALVADSQNNLIKGALDGMPLKSIADMYRLGQRLLKVAPSLKVPTLLIHSDEDECGALDNAELLKSTMGEWATLKVLHDSYHMVHVDRERSKVVAMTLAHVAAHGGQGAEQKAHG